MKFENNNICPIYLFCIIYGEFQIKEDVRILCSGRRL